MKDGSDNHKLYYKDIGEYLSQSQKLKILKDEKSLSNIGWEEIFPDENNDWINQRDIDYDQNYISLQDKELGVFNERLTGINTSRDAWVYGFNKIQVKSNVLRMVENYNSELKRLRHISKPEDRLENINRASEYINWSRSLRNKFSKGDPITVETENIQLSMYRPFVKKWLFYDKSVVEMPGQYHRIKLKEQLILATTGLGIKRDFSAYVTQHLPNFDLLEKGQNYFLGKINEESIFENDFISNVNAEFKKKIGITNDDKIFSYLYGLFHSKDYLKKYSNDLKKGIPRIPILKNKDKFIDIGQELSKLHLNYEEIEPYKNLSIEIKNLATYKVKKMKFLKERNHAKKLVDDKSTIIFNEDITIKNIPEEAYNYIINGKSAIQWIMEQYQIKMDKNSGITDDPNLYSDDEKYIFNLLLKIINVSVQTVDLVNSLPPLEVIEE